MSNLSARIVLTVLLLAVSALNQASPLASPASGVAINGVRLTEGQLYALQMQLRALIPAGSYLLAETGCWVNLSTGASGCFGAGDFHSRYGSGERTTDGSWNHYSDAADMGVGGTADGCIYTTSGWSNC